MTGRNLPTWHNTPTPLSCGFSWINSLEPWGFTTTLQTIGPHQQGTAKSNPPSGQQVCWEAQIWNASLRRIISIKMQTTKRFSHQTLHNVHKIYSLQRTALWIFWYLNLHSIQLSVLWLTIFLRKFDLSTWSPQLTHHQPSPLVKQPVSITKAVNQWAYHKRNLLLAYSVAIIAALFANLLGAYAYFRNKVSHDLSFSSLASTTTDQTFVDRFRSEDPKTRGKLPLPESLKRVEIKFTPLDEGGLGFQTADEVRRRRSVVPAWCIQMSLLIYICSSWQFWLE